MADVEHKNLTGEDLHVNKPQSEVTDLVSDLAAKTSLSEVKSDNDIADAIEKKHSNSLDHSNALDHDGSAQDTAIAAKTTLSAVKADADIADAISKKHDAAHSHAGYYTLHVQALTSSPADGATIYFGQLPKAPTTTANISKVYIRKAGTIRVAEIYCYSGTAGTNENWSLYVRLNNTTDYLIATLGVNTNERVFSKTDLAIAVAAGDYIEIKAVNPTWATNPLTTIFGGHIDIET